MPKHMFEFMIAMTVLALAPSHRHLIAGQHSSVLMQRPLTLPSIRQGDSCTIAVGRPAAGLRRLADLALRGRGRLDRPR